MTSSSFELVKQYQSLDPVRRAMVRDRIAKAKYLELAILLNDPDARRGLDEALSDYRRSREDFTSELVGFVILMIILSVAIYKSIWS